MYQCANVQMCKCINVQMCKCANVQMCKCANVQMCLEDPEYSGTRFLMHRGMIIEAGSSKGSRHKSQYPTKQLNN